MKAVVFGGSGFIGSHLTASLVARGYEVVIADIAPPERLLDGVTYEPCDVRKQIELKHDVPFDAVYNLAAVHRTPGHEPHEYYETNILGAENVTEWADVGGEQYICFTSSISVYGPSEEPKDESSPLEPNSDYGRSKVIAETIHRRWQCAQAGRRLVIARPAVVFGPGERGNFTRLANALARRRFMYPGRKDVVKSCGYVQELIDAIAFMEGVSGGSATFNFCYPERYTLEQICLAFHTVADYPTPGTVPVGLVNAVLKAQSWVNFHGEAVPTVDRVGKLTVSTDIVPSVLMQEGYAWKTDILTGLSAWQQASTGEGFM